MKEFFDQLRVNYRTLNCSILSTASNLALAALLTMSGSVASSAETTAKLSAIEKYATRLKASSFEPIFKDPKIIHDFIIELGKYDKQTIVV